MSKQYFVEGSGKLFAVVHRLPKTRSLAEYDLIESREEADVICDVLNEGKGPEWDKIETEVGRRLKSLSRRRVPIA